MTKQKKFFCIFICIFLCLLVPTLAINILIDPFNFFQSDEYTKITWTKETDTFLRMRNAIDIVKKKPQSLIFGSSRVFVLPLNHYQEITKSHSLNSGFQGASFDEIYEYFLHATYVQPNVTHVLIGIDLMAFNITNSFKDGYIQERLQRNSYTNEDLASLLMYTALKSSFSTILNTIQSYNNAKNDIEKLGSIQWLSSLLFVKDWYKDYQIDEKKIAKFKAIVDICKEKNINLKVYVNPLNAIYTEFYFQNDLWKHFKQLKTELASIYPVWDFSGFNEITTEKIKLNGKPVFSDCSHFSPEIGQILLDIIYEQPNAPKIGHLLSKENVEQVNEQILKDRDVWSKENKELVERTFL